MEITTENNFNAAIANNLSIIYFFAQWCGPCKMFAPMYAKFAQENPQINMNKVDIDVLPDIAANYGIMSIPTLVAFSNGQEKDRIIGIPRDLGAWIKILENSQR